MSKGKRGGEEALARAKAAADQKAGDATLRDEFAKAALAGLVAMHRGDSLDVIGRLAYAAADAAILARDLAPEEEEATEEAPPEEAPPA